MVLQVILRRLTAVFLSVYSVGASADALDGCVNSPENPTMILAFIGLAAAGINKAKAKD